MACPWMCVESILVCGLCLVLMMALDHDIICCSGDAWSSNDWDDNSVDKIPMMSMPDANQIISHSARISRLRVYATK
jgi:hypothetical protein